jgi:hypothetical protein
VTIILVHAYNGKVIKRRVIDKDTGSGKNAFFKADPPGL